MAQKQSQNDVDLSGQTVWVIDLFSRVYQLFHALPEMSSPEGTPVSVVFGLTRDLIDITEKKKPNYLFCGSDTPEPTFRHKQFEDYKATRSEMPADLVPQLPLVKKLLEVFGVPCLELAGYEADDVLATLAVQTVAAGGDCTLVTSDKDARQLLGPHVRLLNLRNNAFVGEAELLADWGIRPDQVVDYLSLVGDAVDNVPGIPGIGPKIASSLLQQFGTLEEILSRCDEVKGKKRQENIALHGDTARQGRSLIQLELNTPIQISWESAVVQRPDPEPLTQFLQELGFKTLVKKVQSLSGGKTSVAKPSKTSDQGLLALGDESQGEHARYPAPVLPAKDSAVTSAVKKLRESLSSGGCLIVSVTESAVRGRSKAGEPPVWPEVTGLTLLAHTDSNPQASVWFSAKQVTSSEALRKILSDPRVPKVGYDLKRQIVALSRLGIDLVGLQFDPLIAGHLLDAGQRNQGLSDLLDRFADVESSDTQVQDVPQTAEQAASSCHGVASLVDVLSEEIKTGGFGSLFSDVELPLAEVLSGMESRGVRVDTKLLSGLSDDYTSKIKILEKEAHELAGHAFSLSSPLQVRTVLFEEQGLPVVKRTKTGPSTDAEVLEELAPLHELPAKLLQHRKYSKLKSTYVDALPFLVDPRTSRIHTTFNQTVTATGRLSSSDPNLQNIPIRTAEGQQIRSAFQPAEEGWHFLAADYSQIELRILAHLSGDAAMLEAFRNEEDIHTRTAAAVFEVESEEVTSEMRRTAKAVNFGILYGQSAFGLAKALGISQPEAAEFIAAYFEKFAGASQFIDEVLDRCRAERGVATMLGRRRAIDGVRDHEGRRGAGGVFALSLPERTAVNTVVQGSAADLIKLAMLKVARRLVSDKLSSFLVLQIHDELLFEYPRAESEPLQALVVHEMGSAMDLEVPLEVSVQTGSTWADCEK
jgi:DNA polymerase-1